METTNRGNELDADSGQREWASKQIGKMDLIAHIVEETGCTKVLATRIVELFLGGIASALVEGRSVELRRFGKFSLATWAPRVARNPGTNEAVPLPQRRVVKFKAGSELARIIKHFGPNEEEAA